MYQCYPPNHSIKKLIHELIGEQFISASNNLSSHHHKKRAQSVILFIFSLLFSLTENQIFHFQFPLFSNRKVISIASRYELVSAAINTNLHLLH
jgi:hypothetical protein